MWPCSASSSASRNGFDDCEDNQQCKQHQRFDQSQTENHHGLNTTGSAGVACRAFDGCRCNARLAERAQSRRDGETETGGERFILINAVHIVCTGLCSGLRQHGLGDQASKLETTTLELAEHGGICEYFDPLTGEGRGSDDFSWTAAVLLDILRAEHA